MSELQLSDLEKALSSRTRRTFEFDFVDYIGGTKLPLGKFRLRIATVAEQDQAVYQAYKYCEKVAKEHKAASNDPDLLNNAKTAFLLQKVCLHPVNDHPVFSGPEWMLQNMSTDELAKLLECYQLMLKEFSPFDFDLSDEKLEALISACFALKDSDLPNVMLTNFTSDQKGELIVRLSIKLIETRQEQEKMKKQ